MVQRKGVALRPALGADALKDICAFINWIQPALPFREAAETMCERKRQRQRQIEAYTKKSLTFMIKANL